MGELEEKIKKELLKSGFPLEVFSQRCLLNHKWGTSGSEYMLSDGEVTKQIDTMGHFQEELGENTTIFYTLHIECKKNHANPWVFFKGEIGHYDILTNYDTLQFKKLEFEITDVIKGLHYNRTPLSSIHTMAFQTKDNQIYKAIHSLISSYEFHREFFGKHRKARKPKYNIIDIDFLTILFDGKLYLANFEKDESLNLVEKNHIIYYHCEVKYPTYRHYNIEIISKDYFTKYLNILNKDRKLISDFYRKQISSKGT